MRLPQNDADVEQIVARSGLFRAARRALLAIDTAIASSALARHISSFPRPALGGVLIVAAVTHGVLVSMVPAEGAPVGRYLFAIAGAAAGAVLLASSRAAR
jgi:hypothetical protein